MYTTSNSSAVRRAHVGAGGRGVHQAHHSHHHRTTNGLGRINPSATNGMPHQHHQQQQHRPAACGVGNGTAVGLTPPPAVHNGGGGRGAPRGASPQRYATNTNTNNASSSPSEPIVFDYLFVVDFEATCERNHATYPNEIIEFPVVVVDVRRQCVFDTFHSFVRPVINPRLSPFCTQLTGIRQTDVDQAPLLPQVVESYQRWLAGRIRPNATVAYVCDGTTDMNVFMFKQAVQRDGTQFPPQFYHWIDVRKVFYETTGYAPQGGISGMLESLGMRFVGVPHSGSDDARNIARILIELIGRGARITRETVSHVNIKPQPRTLANAANAAPPNQIAASGRRASPGRGRYADVHALPGVGTNFLQRGGYSNADARGGHFQPRNGHGGERSPTRTHHHGGRTLNGR